MALQRVLEEMQGYKYIQYAIYTIQLSRSYEHEL